MPDPSCPAGSEQKDASQKLIWVDNDTIAAALGDWWTVLSYLKYIPPFLPVWLPSFCSTVPTGPFEITDEDWASLATGEGFTVVDVLNVVRNRVNWYVWNEYCQCVGTDEGEPVDCYPDAVLQDDPWLYWKLDDASGSFADSSGNGRDGTMQGTGLSYNQAGPFTGSAAVGFNNSAWIAAPTGSQLTGTSWAIEAWAYLDPDASIAGGKSIAGSEFKRYLAADNNGNQFTARDNNASGAVFARDGNDWTVRRGGWNHWVAQFDATDNTLELWCDGAKRADVANGGASAAPTGDFTVGIIRNAGATYLNPWKGRIAHVAAYQHVLSPARIAAHYAARLGGCPTAPTAIDPPPDPVLPVGIDAPPTLECDEAQLCVDINRIRVDLANAITQLNVVQRQAAPFAYTLDETFPISGSGSVAVRGILALSVDFSAIPEFKARKGSTVVDYMDIGYLSLGTAEGWISREVLRHDQHLVANIPGYVDRIGYDLAPGVTATLRTYRRLA